MWWLIFLLLPLATLAASCWYERDTGARGYDPI